MLSLSFFILSSHTLSPQGVDLAGLLFNIHDFFLYLGVDEIRKRSSSDDKPLRMVKTILHELCKILVGRLHEWVVLWVAGPGGLVLVKVLLHGWLQYCCWCCCCCTAGSGGAAGGAAVQLAPVRLLVLALVIYSWGCCCWRCPGV